MSAVERVDCARARRVVHARLDGEALAPDDASLVDVHLAGCDACRAVVAELEEIQRELRSVQVPGLEAAALERVWERTSRAGPARRGSVARRSWRVAAAAAGLALALGGLPWIVVERRDRAMAREAEIRRAAGEARFVLAVAGSALRRAERATTDKVLVGGIGAALDRTSIRWSGATGSRPTRGGNGV